MSLLKSKKSTRTDSEYKKAIKEVSDKTFLHVQIPQDQYDKFRMKAIQNKKNVSVLIRKWVQKYIED